MSTIRVSRIKRGAVIAALAGLVGAAAWAAVTDGWLSADDDGTTTTAASIAASSGQNGGKGKGPATMNADGDTPQTFIVVFRDEPLATYQGGVAGIDKPIRKGNGRGRIDAKSRPARDYVRYLEDKQRGYEARIDRALGRQAKVSQRWQHALNAIVTQISPLEAREIQALPEVQLVEPYREDALDTNLSTHLVGAANVWDGVPAPLGDGPDRAQGEGVVVGIIDTGINFGSPSFAATDPVDGYKAVNPNGAGNYLGTCAPGGIDAGRCNDKLIGGYDFVCNVPVSSGGTICSRTTLYREEPSFGDTNGHGSHTASTVAGNRRIEMVGGEPVTLSGVAPRANIIAYDVCYTNLSTGQGSCPNVSSVGAVNQAIADGVDVINFSIGGGSAPWSDAVSLAFLNATDAGIFVAASAGNDGPFSATLGHVEPWVASSAASRHRPGGTTSVVAVTGPGVPPENVQRIIVNPGTFATGVPSTPLSAPLPGTTPLVISPFYNRISNNAFNDACSSNAQPLPSGAFQGAIAVIHRGTCSFTEKVNNAASAGAVAVILVNNAANLATGLIPSVPGTTIPVFGASAGTGLALYNFATANPGVTASLATNPNVLDSLADFSSRGPSGYNLMKPDISAPGVDVVAAYAGSALTGYENIIGALSGTSMASPHTAGAAALLRQLHPSWTVPEIKSALMLTSNESVVLEDQVTPANGHAGGSGRLQIDRAARAGLVLDEAKDRFVSANPAIAGNPDALNLASMLSTNCTGVCTFTRTFRSTLAYKHQWRLKLEGIGGTVEPASLTLKPGESRQVLVTLDNSGATRDGSYRWGKLTIEPSNSALGAAGLPSLHLPIALRAPPPPPASTIALANGVAMPVSGAAGSNLYFSFAIPAGASSASFVLQGDNGDADLFVKWGEAPNGVYDCVSNGSTANETCTLVPRAGTYYIRIEGYAAYTGATLTASYQ